MKLAIFGNKALDQGSSGQDLDFDPQLGTFEAYVQPRLNGFQVPYTG